MKKDDFLFEILTEELPPKSLKTLSDTFEQLIKQALHDALLNYKSMQSFATPRRLAILIEQLDEKQADQIVERKGPAVKAAFDAKGHPTQACIGFAQSCGLDIDELDRIQTDKGEFLFTKKHMPGKSITELMPIIIEKALFALPIKKHMKWGNYDFAFIRPVHNILMLYGKKIIPAEMFALKSNNTTLGHRFHAKGAITITTPSQYGTILKKKGYVIADFATRMMMVREQAEQLAKKTGGTAIIPQSLLEEVTSSVEWPVSLLATFDKSYLTVPKEALIASIQQHQKCFPIVDKDKNLLPKFIAISNIESYDNKQVIQGNERVMHARLNDAKFFYETDLKIPLEHRLDALKYIVFEKELGSLRDKTERITQLAEHIAEQLNADKVIAKRAALLSKTDLLTEMVGEFPELQGMMGCYYAKHHQEPEEVAIALQEQYLPRFAEDDLPKTIVGQILALADRIDTLISIFGINKIPTGDKDPYALRRAAFGIIKIIIENRLEIDLKSLLTFSHDHYAVTLKNKNVVDQTLTFIEDRLKSFMLDHGFTANQFAAVQANQIFDLPDFYLRLQAVQTFSELEAAESLAAANKRVINLLNKEKIETLQHTVDEALLKEPAEKALHQAIIEKTASTEKWLDTKNYTETLKDLASLREPIDQFFDAVMVMTDDASLRNNRLILLEKLRDLFLQVADISLL